MPGPRVFSIPAGVPFLPQLADELLAGRFGPVGPPDDPFALADVTILLPTRRAVRALRQILVGRTGVAAAILPRIRPIGDVDEEAHLLEPPPEDPADALVLPPSVSRLERLIALTRLVVAWGRTVRRSQLPLSPDEPLLVPASAGDAARLAADLARLIDDMEIAGIAWDRLGELSPADYPGYWQLTLDFLRIAAEAWPAHLAEHGVADPSTRRDTLLRAEAARLAKRPPPGPVIAAGSTGSVPATAALLAAIARLPNGSVVLPGLDPYLDTEGWAAIAEADGGLGAPSHPQAGLRQLLSGIGIVREDVVPLGTAPPALAERSRVLAEAMRPATTTEAWAARPAVTADAFAGVDLMVARNEQEEALAIAVALRESVETDGQVAALVTPDRALARRVAVELGRWSIRVDDSAGRPLDTTPAGVFARLLAETALRPEPVRVLALAKHPLAAFGMHRTRCRRAARALEAALFRGTGRVGRIADLHRAVTEVRFATEMKADRFIPRVRRRLSRHHWQLAEELADAIGRTLGPLEAAARGDFDAADATRLLAAALDAAMADDKGVGALWGDPSGEALATLLEGLLAADRLTMPPHEFPAFLQAMMAGVAIAPPLGADPRVHIWGTLEARLQAVDLVILGGLDEGVWPAEPRTDPWLSRRMRAAIGLPPPERRIGLSAHDFTEAMASPRVIVTRAQKRGGAPTVMSRWLRRLAAVAGEAQMAEMAGRGDRVVALARLLDRVKADAFTPAPRPAPAPPLHARPREISITSVETLIRDPYAVYARRILGLEPLEPVGQRADPRLRGTLIHEAFAAFTAKVRGPFDEAAIKAFLAIWDELFREISAFPEVHVVWTLRAPRLAQWLADWEAARDPEIEARFTEVAGSLEILAPAGPFKLTGRADRIDLRRDGRVEIYDYKTGNPPTARQVLLFAPQMALEAAMVTAGAFGDPFRGRSVAELAWIALGRVGKDGILRPAADDAWTPDSLGAEAMARLHKLIAAYDDPLQPYRSQVRPMFERRFPGDYDHLARVSEWRLATGPAP
ncbi:MAG: double-strand break repair protein AddB [Bauldia sp.]|nr:double-strand break repair protein AddB [Bauldia sp.]